MRKTDILCKEKFNNNLGDTINYIMRNFKDEELYEYVKEFTPNEKTFARNVLYKVSVEEHGQKKVKQMIREECDLQFLNLTKDEVKSASKNPYKAKLGKSLLKLLIINGGIIALSLLMKNFDLNTSKTTIETLAVSGMSIFSSLTAMDIGVDLLKYFKFKKLKKQYNKELEEQNNVVLENQGGKTL